MPALASGPPALGYLRVLRHDPRGPQFWAWAISGFCVARGLALRCVFADAEVTGGAAPNWEGWRLLLAYLGGQAEMTTVVVPALVHLSGDLARQRRMCAQVAAAGGLVQPLSPVAAGCLPSRDGEA